MKKNVSVRLDEHFNEFIAEKVREGRDVSASAVVCAGLRLLEEQDARLETLRIALLEGEKGLATPFDVENFLRRRTRPKTGGETIRTKSRSSRISSR